MIDVEAHVDDRKVTRSMARNTDEVVTIDRSEVMGMLVVLLFVVASTRFAVSVRGVYRALTSSSASSPCW
jgi:hypothetical protein